MKKTSDSFTIMNEIVLPNDTNPLHNLRGGKLLHWMDICAAISAQKHTGKVCVTASVNNVSFSRPIKLGHVVTIHAKVVKVFNTSMEVFIEVWAQNLTTGEKCKSNEAFYTFVALSSDGKPVKVEQVKTETEKEQELADHSVMQKQLKLLLAKKIQLKDAPEFKEQFLKWLDEDK